MSHKPCLKIANWAPVAAWVGSLSPDSCHPGWMPMTAALGQEETRDRDYFRLDSKGGQRRGAPCPRGLNRPWRKIGWWARFALPTLCLLPTLELHPAFAKILSR